MCIHSSFGDKLLGNNTWYKIRHNIYIYIPGNNVAKMEFHTSDRDYDVIHCLQLQRQCSVDRILFNNDVIPRLQL